MSACRPSRLFIALFVVVLARASGQQLPADTRMLVELETPISSRDAVVGQPVELKVLEPVLAKDRTVLVPAGAKLWGKVTHVVRSRAEDKTGEISFKVERGRWNEQDVELNAYPVTMAMPLVLKDETPDDAQLNTGQIYNAPIAITKSAQIAVNKEIRKRAQDPSSRRSGEDEFKLRVASQPVPDDWGMIRAENPEIWTIIGSNARDISLPKRMRFILRHVAGR